MYITNFISPTEDPYVRWVVGQLVSWTVGRLVGQFVIIFLKVGEKQFHFLLEYLIWMLFFFDECFEPTPIMNKEEWTEVDPKARVRAQGYFQHAKLRHGFS